MSPPDLDLSAIALDLGDTHFRFDLHAAGTGLVAVMGPSGSGKSTLLNIIAGFLRPATGTVRINGRDVTGLLPGERPVSMIFQDHNLFAHLDVAQNVGLGLSPSLHLSPDDRARVEAALGDVGLAGQGRRRPDSLSGGERQRVAFARALLRARPLLLLDEPFAALDEDLRAGMGDLLTAFIRRTGALALMVTHDRGEALRLADRIITIEDGSIVSDELSKIAGDGT